MRKRVCLLLVVVLALATTAPAASFWAGLLTNGSWRWGGLGSGPQSNSGANANSAGIQYADTDGTTGGGLVLQAEGAAGFQDSDEDSQEQGMVAGMGQLVASTGDGSATGLQAGVAGQTQTSDVGTQSAYAAGIQYAYVNTSGGGTAVATQTAVILVYQSQEQTEDPE